jgi:protein-tyrosine kinase
MSRIHEALKKAEQEKLARLKSEEEAHPGPRLASEEEAHPGPRLASEEGAHPRLRLAGEEAHPRPQLKEEEARPRIAAEETRPTVTATEPVVEPTRRVIELPDGAGTSLRYDEVVKRCARTEWNLSSGPAIFGNGDIGKVGAEGFRTLRSRLFQIASTRRLRRLLITSSVPAEGKTFVATHLAKSIIQQPDQRVLLIDADLRAPQLNNALGTASTPGLAEYLQGQADEYAVIQKNPSSNLCVIPCGARVSNPSELLLSSRMKELLDRVTPAFDWVILDSPPSLPVHDANNLAGLCEGVLLIVRAGKTDYESAKKAALEFQHKNLIGVVLNRVSEAELKGSYYYGYTNGK